MSRSDVAHPGTAGEGAAGGESAAALRRRRLLRLLRLKAPWLIIPLFFWQAQPVPALIVVGAVIALAGLLLRGWAAGIIEKNAILITGGPYAFVRHPLYVGTFLIISGLMLAGGDPEVGIGVMVFLLIVYPPVVKIEEKELERRFGEEFRGYAARVPRFMPRNGALRRPAAGAADASLRFQLVRYLQNREYVAVIATAAVFLLALLRMLLG